MAVRRLLDGAKVTDTSDGLARAIGGRIRGTYGFDLRRMADMNPDRPAEELYALVIVPHEFPWDTAAAIDAAESRAGQRDAARVQRYGPFFDPDDPTLTPAEEVAGRVDELRKRL